MKCPVLEHGKEYRGDSLEMMKCLPGKSVNLVVTSPPYAQMRKKHYGGIDPDAYAEWFAPFAKEINRVLADDGSFVFNIKENVVNGERHPYVTDTVKKIREQGFKHNETYIWNKSNPYPITPARRFKDGFEYIFHFTKNSDFKFRPERVMKPTAKNYCKALQKRIGDTFDNGLHPIKYSRFLRYCDANGQGMSYPSNVMTFGASRSTRHPAQFPFQLPEFFVKSMSDPGDTVLDPFAGAGTTISVAKKHCRKGIGFDLKKEFVDGANAELKGITCGEG